MTIASEARVAYKTWNKDQRVRLIEAKGRDTLQATDDLYLLVNGFGGRPVFFEKGLRHVKQTVLFEDGSSLMLHLVGGVGIGRQITPL